MSSSASGDEEEEPTTSGEESEEEEESGASDEAEEEEEEVVVEEDGGKAEEVLQVADEATQRQANIKALLSNSLQTTRAPVMSRYLKLREEDQRVLKRAFVSPKPGAPALSEELRRKLVARRKWVPWGSNTAWTPPTVLRLPPVLVAPTVELAPVPEPPPPPKEPLPPGVEPLVLWVAPDVTEPTHETAVIVDPMLTKWLRPHQREGVAFMFECVAGLRGEGQGCILADDMGLGKTLQGLALLWTLTNSGHALLGGRPMARRSLIVCPTSLVGNWATEAKKWLNGRLTVLALSEASRDDVVVGVADFLHPRNPYKVLILSYETFRIHAESFKAPGSCDLLICDEAHRLKNDATLTNRALDSLPCRRRVLLSGTPMQNHLDEFFAMVDFCNPGVLGTPAEFRRRFESPILAGREPGAEPEVVAAGESHSAELSGIVNTFILRRTNTLLSAHLPPKVVMVVCCKLTSLQLDIYRHFLESKAARKILGGKGSNAVLPAISNLKKLCNHPKLIYDAVHSRVVEEEKKAKGNKATAAIGFEGVAPLFPPCLFDDGRPGRGSMAIGWEGTSGKFGLAARMLAVLWEKTDDKIVLVSNYTQTLDLFATLCRERNYPVIRLDGSTSVGKREKLVQQFNDLTQSNFIFLLSSKAGGCGLNLVGANRLMLFDCDWNPAVDKQAAARVWRDGQQRRVYVYRLVATGTIEEKVFQRQLSKEGLQSLVSAKGSGGGAAAKNLMSADELRELFALHEHTPSSTWEVVRREERAQKAKAAAVAAAAAALASASDAPGEGGAGAQGRGRGGGRQRRVVMMAEEEEDEGEGAEEVEEEGEEGGDGVGGGGEAGSRGAQRGRAAGSAGGGGRDDEMDTETEDMEVDAAVQLQGPIYKEQQGSPSTEEELAAWGHHSDPATVPDLVLQRCAGEDVSFVFSCQVAGKHVEETVFQPRAKPGIRLTGLGNRKAAGIKRPAAQTTTAGQQPPIPRPAPTPSAASTHLPSKASTSLSHPQHRPAHQPWAPRAFPPAFGTKPTAIPRTTAPANTTTSQHNHALPTTNTTLAGPTATSSAQLPLKEISNLHVPAAAAAAARGKVAKQTGHQGPAAVQTEQQGHDENTIVLISDDEM